MSYERWAIVVMDRDAREWQARFLAELAERGVTLAGDELMRDGVLVGSARFEPLTAASAQLAAWIGGGARPFLGAPAGLFVWRHYLASRADRLVIVPAIARAARGAVEDLDSHELRELVVRRRFALSELLSEHGLDEGRALLELKASSYLDSAAREARRILIDRQLDVWSGVDPESRPNPLRIVSAGELGDDARVALDHAELELWAFDEALASGGDEFWIDADD
jgi:hypothetical protein